MTHFSTFLDIYIQRDLENGTLTESQAQELIDHMVMKFRMVKFARIPNTAHIGVIEISEGMLPLVENNPNFEVLTEPYDLPFDENGNLF